MKISIVTHNNEDSATIRHVHNMRNDAYCFIELNEQEALILIQSLVSQINNKSPNVGRIEFPLLNIAVMYKKEEK
jgi:hypothetical protein